MSTLASRLIEARTDKGWNKTELKKAAGLKSPSTLTDLESGLRTKSPQLPSIADALGVEVLWLQFGTLPKARSKAAPAVQQDPPTQDPTAELLAQMPPGKAAKLRLQIKYEYDLWKLEEADTHTHQRESDPPLPAPKLRHSS